MFMKPWIQVFFPHSKDDFQTRAAHLDILTIVNSHKLKFPFHESLTKAKDNSKRPGSLFPCPQSCHRGSMSLLHPNEGPPLAHQIGLYCWIPLQQLWSFLPIPTLVHLNFVAFCHKSFHNHNTVTTECQ